MKCSQILLLAQLYDCKDILHALAMECNQRNRELRLLSIILKKAKQCIEIKDWSLLYSSCRENCFEDFTGKRWPWQKLNQDSKVLMSFLCDKLVGCCILHLS